MEVNAFVEAYLNQDYDHLETLRSKNASKEDFDKAASQINALRKGVLTHLIDMRFQVISNTTEDEWGKISKELDQLFKKGKGIV
jgi:predicted metalloprotease